MHQAVPDLKTLAQREQLLRVGEFSAFCRFLMLGRGQPQNAVAMAQGHASQRVLAMLSKATTLPGGGGGADSWGEDLQGARLVLSAFTDALKFSSAFAAAAATNLFARVPLGDALGVVMAGASAAVEVDRGDAIPVRRLDVANATVPRRKVAGQVVLSQELLRAAPATAESVISRELLHAIGAGIDAAFVADLTSGLSPHTAGASPLDDALVLMQDVGLRANSRPFWICGPAAAQLIATAHSGNVRAAPDVSPTAGGSWFGWPFYVSAGIDSLTLALVDGSKIAGALELPEVSFAAQALVESDDQPTGGLSGSPLGLTGLGTTNLVSLWQQDCAATKVTQFFGFQVVRSGAASTVSYAGSP